MLINNNWNYYKEGEEDKKTVINLPFDCMLRENRDISNPGGTNISFFEGGKYIFEKKIVIDDFADKDQAFLEFEGVYTNPEIFINGKKAYSRHYGYSDFIFNATDYLFHGVENTIKVIADNSSQPNSRWYTGSGIYRNVHLHILKETHFVPRQLKITTLDYKSGLINIKDTLSLPTDVTLTVLDAEGKSVYEKKLTHVFSVDENITIEKPELWSTNYPYLYTAELTCSSGKDTSTFGIRQLELSTEKGFLINGERVVIYGACIHHDNGLLGAVCDPFSERRKARILKESGYNAVRSAHNPISKAFLDEADKIGLLVMDEFADCWYIHKTKYDYASYCMEDYPLDLKDLVDKDYNHPSVIFYSVGNEVAETSQQKGIDFVKVMKDYLHSLDSTRPVTCGINIFFNALFSMGFGVYSDKKSDKEATKKPKKKKKSVGSEFFNNLAGLLGADFMKFGATLPISDRKTYKAFANMDVAGYNYGIKRYKHDIKKYPSRFILGSETFCADSGLFYDLSQKNPRVIGDFVWAGWDYLGEAGIGSWVACEDESIKENKAGWLLAGSGRIDILGNPSAEMEYTKTAFRQKVISLAVVSPRDFVLGHSPSSWKLSWALRSYSFQGYEGKKTQIEVYSQADQVKVFQNDKLIYSKKKKDVSGRYCFKATYLPGTLKAVAYDSQGNELGSEILKTGDDQTNLVLRPEDQEISLADGLAYVHISFEDSNSQVLPLLNEEIEITGIKNGELLGLGNACPYYPDSYLKKTTKTYYGKAMAIVRPLKSGTIEITCKSQQKTTTCSINVK